VNIHGFDWRLGGRIVRKCVVNGTKKSLCIWRRRPSGVANDSFLGWLRSLRKCVRA
jgi:hypothetical protein